MAVEYIDKWIGGVETLKFKTPDGDLDFTQFARFQGGYLVRTKPKEKAGVEWYPEEDDLENKEYTFDVTGLEEVEIDGKAYYNFFKNAKGEIVRQPTTSTDYWRVANEKNAQKPVRKELVDELPPEDSSREPTEPHSIAFDDIMISDYEVGPLSSFSWSHECTGTDRLLVVNVGWFTSYSDRYPTSVTFNGDSHEEVDHIQYSVRGSALWYMVAPDVGGSYTVSVVFNDVVNYARGCCDSYVGVDQSSPLVDSDKTSDYNDQLSLTLTTPVEGCWCMSTCCMGRDSAEIYSNLTDRCTTNVTSSATRLGVNDTNGPVTPAGNQTITWTTDSTATQTMVAAAFRPAAGGNDYTETVNDGIGISDSEVNSSTFSRSLSESIGIADDKSQTAAVIRLLADGLGLTDSPESLQSMFRVLDASLGLTDSWSIGQLKTIADSIGLTDEERSKVHAAVRAVSDTVGVSDSLARVFAAIRSISDEMNLTDEAVEQTVHQIIETINDSVGLTDSQTGLSVIVRTIADDLGMTDSTARLCVVLRLISDSAGLTDGLILSRAMNISETLGVTDSVSKVAVYLKTSSETIGLSDDFARIYDAVVAVSDTVGVTDDLSSVWSILRTVAETLGLTDEISEEHTGHIIRVISDIVGMNDSKSDVFIALRTLTETIGVEDSFDTLFGVSRVVSDSIGITDGVLLARIFTIADSIGITDDISRIVTFLRTQTDTEGILDSILNISAAFRNFDDSVGITDSESHILGGLIKAAWAFMLIKKSK